jgi:hypothetical protein
MRTSHEISGPEAALAGQTNRVAFSRGHKAALIGFEPAVELLERLRLGSSR